jgi:hypothetical protein
MINNAIIAVDFDGTVCTHEYPLIGKDIGAVPVIKRLAENNRLILYTMRSGEQLHDAYDWFLNNGIPLWGVNVNPAQAEWTSSPKCYANIYIDDAALGAPIVYGKHERPYIDWAAVECMLLNYNTEHVKIVK